jgi:hypothetical protein
VQALHANGVFHEAGRLALEGNAFTKLAGFFANPLPNALALYALNDDNHAGAWIYWLAVAVVIGLLVFAYRKALAASDAGVKRRWLYCLVGLPVLAGGIALVSAERFSTYRVLFAACGLVLVLVAFAFRALVLGEKVKPWFHYPLLAVIWGAIAFAAHHNSFTLLAEPQAQEWELVRSSVLRGNFTKPVRVRIVTPAVTDRSTVRIYGDEFGSLSSRDPLTAQEMFKAALRERFGEKLPKGGSYTVKAEPTDPEAGSYDLLIDLRRLKNFRLE